MAVAFNAGNLEAVAMALRGKFPDVTLILCADDDAATEGNPGITKAKVAALTVGGKIAVPHFSTDRLEGATDFNDVATICGAESVSRAIEDAMEVPNQTAMSANGNGHAATLAPVVESEPEEQPRAFPEIAWSGLFAKWREIVAPCTEAPLENLWAAFLLATGMILGRNVWRESPWPIYANFYLLLIGQTGDSRKSTVMRLACELLNRTGEDFKPLNGVVSSEGIYEALGQREETKGLVYADEFRALLSVGKRKGTQDIIPRLQTLYSCPERDSIDRVKDSTVIVKPFLSLITATPQAYVEDLLGDREIVGGLLNRLFIVSGDEQPPRPIVRQPAPAAWESIAAPLRKIRDRVEADPRHMELEPLAAEAWSEFYTTWKTERGVWSAKHAQLTARTHEHVLKVAMVYSALAGEERISVDSLCKAIAVGGWIQSNTLALFSDTGLDQLGKVEHVITTILKPKKIMYRRDLQRAVGSRGYNAELFNRALTALEKNDVVRFGKTVTGAGQGRPTVEYLFT